MTAVALSLPAPAAARRSATAEPARVRWLLTGIALAFLGLFLVVPLVAVLPRRCARVSRPTSPRWSSPTRSAAIQLTLRVAVISGAGQSRVRRGAAWAIAKFQLPRQEPADRLDRSALRGFARDCRPDLRADVRRAGVVRSVAAGARRAHRVRRAGNRARHRVRDRPLHRARAHSADAGAGHRGRGGRPGAGRFGLADILARHACPTSSGACSTA